MFIFGSLIGDLIGLVIAVLAISIGYCKWIYQYWERKNLPYLKPEIPFGNIGNSVKGKEHIGITIKRIYDEMKSKGWKHGGIFMLLSPNYFLVDLEYVKNIMTKDFQYFCDRTTYFNEEDDPLSAHLVNLTGTKWRNLRSKLTPTFTSGKMKMMFQTLVDCEPNMLKKIESMTSEPIDIKEVLACFTTDIIGSCAFGLECNAFEDENSPFRVYGRKAFEQSVLRRFKRTFSVNFPKIAKMLHLSATPKDVADFYIKVVKDTVSYREKNNYRRNDFMQLLIDLKNNNLSKEDELKNEEPFTIEQVAAQSLVFFLAGFETSSTLMTFTLYELSRHQHIQQKLRDEINTILAQHGGKVTYEALQDMKYLNQVIDESLRVHPPASLVNRQCVKDYKVPGTDLVIEKGTSVIVPILGIHYDEEYYPEPEKFDPERFTEEAKSARPNYTHLPFGEGPRICIGMRFALMQSKVGLVSLLRNFKFTVNKKTKEPLKMQPSSLIFAAEGEIWLNAQKIATK